MIKSSLPINWIKTGILEPHDQSWEAAIPRPAALVWYLQVAFFSSSKKCLSAWYHQDQFTNNHHIFQEISGIWCSNCGASSDLWLTSCCRASRPFPQQGPEWSAGLSSNDITLSHSCSLYLLFDFFLYGLFLKCK